MSCDLFYFLFIQATVRGIDTYTNQCIWMPDHWVRVHLIIQYLYVSILCEMGSNEAGFLPEL